MITNDISCGKQSEPSTEGKVCAFVWTTSNNIICINAFKLNRRCWVIWVKLHQIKCIQCTQCNQRHIKILLKLDVIRIQICSTEPIESNLLLKLIFFSNFFQFNIANASENAAHISTCIRIWRCMWCGRVCTHYTEYCITNRVDMYMRNVYVSVILCVVETKINRWQVGIVFQIDVRRREMYKQIAKFDWHFVFGMRQVSFDENIKFMCHSERKGNGHENSYGCICCWHYRRSLYHITP